MELELPFPPSVNHLWRRVGCRTLLSREGRAYRQRVQKLLAMPGRMPIEGRLAVTIEVHPPDRRRRDLDNLQKALLDSVGHAGVYRDDSQIDDLHIRRRECVPGGRVRVRVEPLDPPSPMPDMPPAPAADSSAKPRTCLKCGNLFDSDGPGNRICSPCHKKNSRLKISEDELQSQRGGKWQNGERMPTGLEVE